VTTIVGKKKRNAPSCDGKNKGSRTGLVEGTCSVAHQFILKLSSEGGQEHGIEPRGGKKSLCLSRGSFRLEEIHSEEPPIACTPLFDKADSLCKGTNPLLALIMWIKKALCVAKNAS